MTNNYETITDEMGVWRLLLNGGRDLIEPSEKWYEKNTNIEIPTPESTQEDYMMDLDYRLSLIELGL